MTAPAGGMRPEVSISGYGVRKHHRRTQCVAAGSATVTAAMSLPLSPLTAMASAVTPGIADFTGGFAGRRSSAPIVAVAVESVGLVAVPLAFLLPPTAGMFRRRSRRSPAARSAGSDLVGFYRAMSLNLIGGGSLRSRASWPQRCRSRLD